MERISRKEKNKKSPSSLHTSIQISQAINTIDLDWVQALFVDMPHATSTTIFVLVKAWGFYETKENNWISHILEHMFFKWWEKYKTATEISKLVECRWWEINAMTDREYCWYYIKFSPEHTLLWIDILSDILVSPQFDPKELNQEKKVIIEELRIDKDDYQESLQERFDRFFYWDNALWRSLFWTIASIKNCTSQTLEAYHKALYTKDNMIVVVAWKIIDKEKIQQQIAKQFAPIPSHKTITQPPIKIVRPKEKIKSFKKWTEQTHLIIWAEWFDRASDNREKLWAEILAVILWGNCSSRLFIDFREKHWLWYYIWAHHEIWGFSGEFLISAWIKKQRFNFGIKQINKQIDEVAKWKFSTQEVSDAIWYIAWDLNLSFEKSDSVAEFYWLQYILNWKIETLEEYIQNYRDITFEDVLKIAYKLSKDHRYMYYIE